jgi:hypothetical protein
MYTTTHKHTQQIIFSVTFKFHVHQFHVMPSLVLRCLAGQAEALSAAEAEEVIYKQTNKQTNNQSFKQSHCNKCVSKPSWGLECVLA